ncbi:uncharacterized protein [Henckelia pumila]|uniref:uncharacterized protein isoform X2 n=1 Tax=Henckelia pumila TaxID=405737 RepID=UPI003C6E1BC0
MIVVFLTSSTQIVRIIWKMTSFSDLPPICRYQKERRTCIYTLFPIASLLFLALFSCLWLAQDNQQKLIESNSQQRSEPESRRSCEDERSCTPPGSESLPKGIVVKTSNLERRPLWGSPEKRSSSMSLFAVPVGIKQKINVDKLVQKFLASNFDVMLFHYDGMVDMWKDFLWSNQVIHVSVDNQTKWWFAKRFLHPDIVAAYDYIFLWDEDLGVDNFHPAQYLSIVRDEGLEISQPALEIGESEVHHLITARWKRSKLHRRTYKVGGKETQCDDNSTHPPCTGWIEVMAPVFSKNSWRCNDLIHAWGLDMQLGYCAQGDRTKTIGVVDAEYIVHYGFPTLGEEEHTQGSSSAEKINKRVEVRRQSYNEYKVFKRRWEKAAKEDQCWIDPYPHQTH